MLVSVGAGLSMVKICGADTPPPGPGLTTVIAGVPPVVRSAAGITAMSVVSLIKVVASGVAFRSATDLARKPVPVIVIVVSGLPASAVFGLMLVSVGAGLVMVKVCGADVPPPGPGVTTVIAGVPAVVRSAAGMTAVNVVSLTKVVASGVASKSAVELLRKPSPVSVMVVSELPTNVKFGLMLVSVGTGLVTVKICGAEVPPPGPGVTTVIDAGPIVVRSAAGIKAVNVVPLTKVVASGVAPKSAVDVLRKSVPVSVMVVSGLPANAEFGLMLVRAGAGLLMVKVCRAKERRHLGPS